MTRFVILTLIVLVVSILFYITADETAVVLGMPLINASQPDPAWIALGGTGVIVIGAGVGLIALTWIGGGVLFATGQLSGGLIAFGQLGIGLIGFAAQVGTGLVGMGQGGLGLYTVTQGGSRNEAGKAFLKSLSAELNEILTILPSATR